MKKRILLLLICIMLAAASFDAAAYPVNTLTEEEALITSFESTGADVLESTISCWAKLNDRFFTIKQIEAEAAKALSSIDADRATAVKNIESGERLNKIVMYGSKENKTYNIAIESVKHETGGETYIVLDVSIDGSYKDLDAERQNIANAVQVDDSLMNFSSCIVGTFKGKLTDTEKDKKTRIALQSINAKKVEGIENEELKSISAISRNVGGYTMSDQARVNVQLAMRYSSYDDKTYIWIGTPLIPMEY
jgi:hypothetical protein